MDTTELSDLGDMEEVLAICGVTLLALSGSSADTGMVTGFPEDSVAKPFFMGCMACKLVWALAAVEVCWGGTCI